MKVIASVISCKLIFFAAQLEDSVLNSIAMAANQSAMIAIISTL
jgi:hypothetical protein